MEYIYDLIPDVWVVEFVLWQIIHNLSFLSINAFFNKIWVVTCQYALSKWLYLDQKLWIQICFKCIGLLNVVQQSAFEKNAASAGCLNSWTSGDAVWELLLYWWNLWKEAVFREFCLFFFFFVNDLYIQPEAWTHNPAIKGWLPVPPTESARRLHGISSSK